MHNVIQFLFQHWVLSALFVVLLLGFLILETQTATANAGVSATEAINLMNNHSAAIIDTRDVELFENGHLINAKSIPAAQLMTDIAQRIKNKSQPILLVCATGKQSAQLVKGVKRAGYEKVSVLSGGIEEWTRQDFPIITGRK